MQQASFNFPILDNYLDDDFLVCDENSKAFDFICNFDQENPNLPKIFAIFGKKCCGKTHLSHIWRRKTDAEFLNIDDFDNVRISNQIEKNQSYIIKNLEEIKNHRALFHVFNTISEKNCNLMITANRSLDQIPYQFVDIASRITNIFTIQIKNPELDLVKVLLIKQFSTRQLLVEDKVIDYLTKNIDRNYEKIVQISKLLEFYCFERKKKITIPFVSEILANNNN